MEDKKKILTNIIKIVTLFIIIIMLCTPIGFAIDQSTLDSIQSEMDKYCNVDKNGDVKIKTDELKRALADKKEGEYLKDFIESKKTAFNMDPTATTMNKSQYEFLKLIEEEISKIESTSTGNNSDSKDSTSKSNTGKSNTGKSSTNKSNTGKSSTSKSNKNNNNKNTQQATKTSQTSTSGNGDARINLKNLDAYNSKGEWSLKFLNKVDIIFAAVRIVGVIISVIILITIGLKFMFASIEEKAEYKKTLIPYLVGALLLFSGSLLARLIYTYAVRIVNLITQ